ncbi:hypothetical protein F5148DRAFT_1149923 [Russula earlei]|uniref:Uncharacterized protein n=1 Tax=Russula earlei TaxID=71964 RepID=A0ACC0U6R3_9AGAM|nr:hypothetical protein F5148DRAFT_1149923 [Russula earlei]
MVDSGSIKVMKDVAVQWDALNLESARIDDSLDQQLAEAEALVMGLRQRKNERALISRLPVEILIEIFSYHSASDRHPHVRFRTPPPWLAVTHVCQRWRDAAVSCPFLWVDIISTNFRWTEEMLKRSRDAPIHITVDDGGSAQKPCELRTARLMFSKIHRAQSLVMTCAQTILSCMPILFDAEAAPLLQELIITNFHPTNTLDLVARPLFSGKTPSLQLLSLYRCRVMWSSPLLQRDLVYLSISHIPHDHRPSLHQVLEVLERLTRLECLQLDEALPIHASSPNETIGSLLSAERLFLRHLRFFSLSARSALDILNLTARVLVPASALFQLICEEFERYNSYTDSGDMMFAALASHLCAPRDTPTGGTSDSMNVWASVRSLHVRDIPAAGSWSLFASTGGPEDAGDDSSNAKGNHHRHPRDNRNDNKDDADTARPPNPADEQMHILSLHLRWHGYPASASAAACFIERAARLPPLIRASTLLIESALFETATAWYAVFARSRHVQAVFAGGGRAIAGAAQMLRDVGQSQLHPQVQTQVFSQEPGAGEDVRLNGDADVYAAIARLLPSRLVFDRPAEKPPRVLFPKLRRLAIAGGNFEDVAGGLFESLRAGLVERRDGEGGPLAQLSIWRCNVLKEQIDALGLLVTESKVRWDGMLHVPPLSSPISEARDGNIQPVHATGAGQENGWHGAATIVEEPELGHGDDDLLAVEGQGPLLVPDELDNLDEN